MDSIGLSSQIRITSIIGRVPSDDELAIRARSLLRWKIRYNSIHVEAENGHLILPVFTWSMVPACVLPPAGSPPGVRLGCAQWVAVASNEMPKGQILQAS